MSIGLVLGYVALPVPQVIQLLNDHVAVLQWALLSTAWSTSFSPTKRCAFTEQNAPQIEGGKRRAEVMESCCNSDWEFETRVRYGLEAFSQGSSLNKAIRRLVYIQVTYHYPKQSLLHEEEATIPLQSSCKDDPMTCIERFTRYLQSHAGRGPAMSSPSRPCIGSSGTFSRS